MVAWLLNCLEAAFLKLEDQGEEGGTVVVVLQVPFTPIARSDGSPSLDPDPPRLEAFGGSFDQCSRVGISRLSKLRLKQGRPCNSM